MAKEADTSSLDLTVYQLPAIVAAAHERLLLDFDEELDPIAQQHFFLCLAALNQAKAHAELVRLHQVREQRRG